MKRLFLLVLIIPTLATLSLAQSTQDSHPRAGLQALSATIRTELESHGERMLGQETYRWSTRLEKMANCRVELSVRIASKLAEETVRTESVNFSLGAIELSTIELQKNWLQLPCTAREKCILSTSTCSRKTKEGFVIDCTTTTQARADTFALQLDGDAAAGIRLDKAFRQAVDLCREPASVTF
jgi:hypothetical protein